MNRIFISIAMFSVFCGCKQEPKACFDVSKSSIMEGETVSFTDCSENASYVDYEFGDLQTSRDENPDHTFRLAGKYEVTQIATNDKGRDETSQTVEVGRYILNKLELISYADNSAEGDAQCFHIFMYIDDQLRSVSNADCPVGVIYEATWGVGAKPNITFELDYYDASEGSIIRKQLNMSTQFNLEEKLDYPDVELTVDDISIKMNFDFELYVPDL